MASIITRQATERDIPRIVELLRLSLGDAGTQKSESFWRWKHTDNPFGPSPVLLAEADGQLVGVRAFMRWNWIWHGREYQTYRPVDTATHPDFQRQGIFRKLTLDLVDQTRESGGHFLFNTPNDQSRPGYLKMGWQERGKLPLRVRAGKVRKAQKEIPPDWAADFSAGEAIRRFREFPPGDSRMHTPLSPEYLHWRYVQCPVRTYGAIAKEDFLLLFTLRQSRPALELRILERFGGSRWRTWRTLRQLIKTFRPFWLTAAPSAAPLPGFLPALRTGPHVTVRPLNLETADLPAFPDWHYSLGDMELF